MPLAIGIGIALITYILRAWPRVGLPDYGADVFFHLALADSIRKDRDRQKITKYFSIGNYNDYPLLLHYLLAPIPKETLEKISGYISPLFDVFNAALLYWFAYWATRSPAAGVAVWLFYLASPQLSLESLTLTPRLLGIFFFNLWALSMAIGVYHASAAWAVASVAAGVACFFTIRFQLLPMLAAGMLFWAATGRAMFLELEAAAFAVSFCLHPRYFINAFISYCVKTHDYARNWRFYGDENERLGGIDKNAPGARKRRFGERLGKEIRMLFFFNPAAWLMAAAGFWLAKAGRGGSTGDIEKILWVWFLMSFAAFLLAERFPQLGQRSGDGYRQFPMFGAFPGAFIAGAAFVESYHSAPVFFAFLAAGLAGSLVLTLRMDTKGYKEKLKSTSSFIRPELKAILERVRGYQWGCVMCLPSANNYSMIYFGDKRVVEVVGRSRPDKKLFEAFIKNREVRLDELLRMFDIDYFFIDTALPEWNQDTSAIGEIVEREGSFIFIRIFPSAKAPADKAQTSHSG
ncbi:MAG: hypothetical protein WCX65_06190 [bacterium]